VARVEAAPGHVVMVSTWMLDPVACVGIRAYASADKHGEWLTMTEAAVKLGVTNHVIRRLIKEKTLPAEQVMRNAPHQIRVVDLEREEVAEALKCRKAPCRDPRQTAFQMITNT